MRLTLSLLKQHNHRMFRRHWLVQGKKLPIDMKSEDALVKKGVQIVEATSFVESREGKVTTITPPVTPTQVLPTNYHATPCGVYGDSNVLLLGMSQAQVLLNTLKVQGLPENLEEKIKDLKIPSNVEKSMAQAVMNVCLFDAEQVKLGYKIKDPERPAFNFPRLYGITDLRKNRLLFHKLIQNCEKVAPPSITSNRRITQNLFFKYPFVRDETQIQLEIHSEVCMTSKTPISSVKDTQRFEGVEMPNIFPAVSTVSLPRTNTYTLENIFPIMNNTQFIHPHTLFLHFSPLEVKHLPDIAVDNVQFESRALMKAFAVAASKARAHLGTNVTELKEPIVIQTVQSDGKRFQFGVFQLNTLDLTDNSKQNYWYSSDIMNLFEECAYKTGKPVLEGYNRDILKCMTVLYNNN